jgi:DNA processing protein
MDNQNLRYMLSLLLVPKIGPVTVKNLLAYLGSAEAVFKQKKVQLLQIPGIGEKLATNISGFKDFARAEAEIAFMEKHGIQPLFYMEEDYPSRLKEIPDSPVLLFYKGNSSMNYKKVIGVVGTRKATEYGRMLTENLIEQLAPYEPLIISGLAYGIDTMAHKAALKNKLNTIGVMGNSLDQIYPNTNRGLAIKMVAQGGLLSEYISGTGPKAEHFPARNRIVAGLVDGLVLVETAAAGGGLITAELASSYDRPVFAFPGRTIDEYSAGCNHLIKVGKASLIENAQDIAYQLGWDGAKHKPDRQKLYDTMKPKEKLIVQLLIEKEKMDMDGFAFASGMHPSELSMLLLELEFQGIIQALPGKFYRLI